jgi:hypothetical protein
MVGVRQSVDPTPILYRLLRRTEWRRRDGTTAHPGRDNTLRASPGHSALPESGNRTGELKRARKLLVDIGWDAAQARVSVPITPVRKVVESSLQKRCDTAPLVAGGNVTDPPPEAHRRAVKVAPFNGSYVVFLWYA